MSRLPALLLGAALWAGCAGGGASGDDAAGDRYGYRLGGADDEGRETMTLSPVTDSTRYLFFPAVVASVDVRTAGRPEPGDAVAVDVVVEGALPDACAALTEVTQRRDGHFVTVTLTMRQPHETVCAAVVRPFRFYVPLDGAFEAGSYTLRLNGRTVPFQILPALDDAG